jgi:hypothetical protein
MAEIQITREQAASTVGWPVVCSRCGAPALRYVEVPRRRRGKDVAHLEVPLCQGHVDHWRDYTRSSVLGFLVGVSAIVLTFVAAWFILDPFGPELERRADRQVGFLVLPWFAGVLLVLPFAIRLGSPVQVRETSTNWVTLAGVSAAFVAAWKASGLDAAGLPGARTLKSAERFEVARYQPDGVGPWPGTLFLLMTALLAGSVAGWCAGRGLLELAVFTQGWDANDIHYLYLIGVLAWAWGLVVLVFLFFPASVRAIPYLYRFALMAVPVALLVVALAWGLSWFTNQRGQVLVKLPDFAGFCVNVPPIFLVVVIVLSQVQAQKVRSWFCAGAAGLMGPLLATAIGCLYTWNTPAFHLSLPISGGFLALAGAIGSFNQARAPFCLSCQNWMQREVLGGLSRPAELVAELIQKGEIVRIAAEPLRESADAGDVELAIYTCPHCRDHGPIVLHAIAVIKNGKKTTRNNLGLWLYPSTAFPVLRKLFPKWRAEQEKLDAPA